MVTWLLRTKESPRPPADGKNNKKQSAPIRREIGATVCGLLALLTILCCFKVNAAFLDLMTSVFRGLIGTGFYILPFSFIMSFLILILHDGRPVALRVTCTFLTAMLIGSLVQLVGGKFDADWDWSVISALWDGGIDGTAGGVLAGGIASLLEALISRIGAAAVVIVGMLLSLITSLNMTVASIVTAIRNRPRAEYAEPQREHKDPAQVLVDTVANKHIEHVQRTEQRRASRASDFDLPVDDPPMPEQPEKKTAGRKTRRCARTFLWKTAAGRRSLPQHLCPSRRRRPPRRRRSSRLSIRIINPSLTR